MTVPPPSPAQPDPSEANAKSRPSFGVGRTAVFVVVACIGAIVIVGLRTPIDVLTQMLHLQGVAGAERVAYISASVFALLVWSLLVALLAFYVCRRSQLAATITLSVVAVLLTLGQVARCVRAASASNVVQGIPSTGGVRASDGLIFRPTFGLAFAAPVSWRPFMNDKPVTVSQWLSPDSKAGDVRGVIMIEAGIPTGPLRQLADGLAQGWGGNVDDAPVLLDGETALCVHGVADGKTARPLIGIVAIHNGISYMLMGGGFSADGCVPQVRAIQASWKWLPLAPLEGPLTLDPDPIACCEGSLRLRMPEIAHVRRADRSPTCEVFGITDLRRNAPAFIFNLQRVPNPLSLDEVKSSFLTGIKGELEFLQEPAWHEVSNAAVAHSVATQACPVVLPGGQTRTMKWALVKVDEGHVALATISLNGQSEKEQKAMDQLAEEVVGTIVPAPK